MDDTVRRINTFLQERLVKENLVEVPALTAAQWLDKVGILADSPAHPGKPLRDFLRDHTIVGAVQKPSTANGRWFITRSAKTNDENAGVPLSPAWKQMHEQPRFSVHVVRADPSTIPTSPGVYSYYRDGRTVYLGRVAGSETLRQRLSRSDLMPGQSLRESAFRSNVAASLGFGQAKSLHEGQVNLTASQMGRVDEWINGCQVAWISCATGQQAVELSRKLKATRKTSPS